MALGGGRMLIAGKESSRREASARAMAIVGASGYQNFRPETAWLPVFRHLESDF